MTHCTHLKRFTKLKVREPSDTTASTKLKNAKSFQCKGKMANDRSGKVRYKEFELNVKKVSFPTERSSNERDSQKL